MQDDQTSILSPDQFRNICQDLSELFPNTQSSIPIYSQPQDGPSLTIWEIAPRNPNVLSIRIDNSQMITLGPINIHDTRMKQHKIDVFQIDPGQKLGSSSLAVGKLPNIDHLLWIGKGLFTRSAKKWLWIESTNNAFQFIHTGQNVWGMLSPWFSFLIKGVGS